jgi:hypothetical protein
VIQFAWDVPDSFLCNSSRVSDHMSGRGYEMDHTHVAARSQSDGGIATVSSSIFEVPPRAFAAKSALSQPSMTF